LNLKPALVRLNGIDRRERSCQFSNANEIHSSDKVNKSLGDSHQRTDLPDRL